MSNENLKTLWNFQEMTQATEKLTVAEQFLTGFRRCIEEAKSKAKGTYEIPDSMGEFAEIEKHIEEIQHLMIRQTKIVRKSKERLGAKLEKSMGVNGE